MNPNWKAATWGTRLWRNALWVQLAIWLVMLIPGCPSPGTLAPALRIWGIVVALALAVMGYCWTQAPTKTLWAPLYQLLAMFNAAGLIGLLLLQFIGENARKLWMANALGWLSMLMVLTALMTLRAFLAGIRSNLALAVGPLQAVVVFNFVLTVSGLMIARLMPDLALTVVRAGGVVGIIGTGLLLIFLTCVANCFERADKAG